MTQESAQPAAARSGNAVPEPSRPVTPKVRRRIWAEPQVRGWLLFAIALLIGAIILAIGSMVEWGEETNVIRNGEVIKAVAWHSGGAKVPGMSLAVGVPVDIEYEYKGQKYNRSGVLYNTGIQYESMKPFDIRVDPKDPAIWANRTDVPSLIEKMMGVGIMLGVAMICVLIMLLLRWRWTALWVDGDLISARIIGQGQSALAPQSVLLRCAVRAGKTERPLAVYVPQSMAPSEGKQTLELIVSHDRSRALAVINYHP